MAVPKRKKSRSRTRHRRARFTAEAPHLTPIRVQGQTKNVPRRLAKAYHRGLIDDDGL
ncbi:50S ribosomal protein L32 [Propioniferax innocua]|uniref:Large ribosomal subunit protein bL32 n=1 Tax=Propioniferax innocua TaxID=1753 RepID=A0A542ZS42_9ACTN|nr:50S ribosomal protein L32 [Propioniferax innocua]TQL63069.1 large subunit ribosomal protein L32 [Propioniferax innocua]